MKRSTPMKRTPMKRSAPLRATGPAKATSKVRKCAVKECRQPFIQRSMTHKACGLECAEILGKAEAARMAQRAAIEDRKQTRAKLEAIKGLKKLRAEAQVEFNRYIRLRDRAAGHGCICCGEPLDWTSTMPGGAVDAGHFVSRGSSPELAFDERNVNAQRKGCNRPGGTTRAKFVAGMTERYGSAVVEELEGPQKLPHLKHDDYRLIRDSYRARANALKKAAT